MDYQRTVDNRRLSEICKSFNPGSKGQTTFYLEAFPKIRIQVTKNGFVKTQGGTKSIDDQILEIIKPHMATTDSQPFTWAFTSGTQSAKELLLERPLEARKNILRGFLDELEETRDGYIRSHKSFFRTDPDENRVRELSDAKQLLTLRSKVDGMDSDTISLNLEEVKDAITQIEALGSVISGLMEDEAYGA